MNQYPNLEELEETDLLAELSRRSTLRARGYCDYCERQQGEKPTCRFPLRHAAPKSIGEALIQNALIGTEALRGARREALAAVRQYHEKEARRLRAKCEYSLEGHGIYGPIAKTHEDSVRWIDEMILKIK